MSFLTKVAKKNPMDVYIRNIVALGPEVKLRLEQQQKKQKKTKNELW